MTRSTPLTWSQVKVGALVVVAMLIVSALILSLEPGMGLIGPKTRFRAIVDHTQGLKIGSPVRMNGVDIGNVHQIAIATQTAEVEVIFTVQSHVATHIREDASIHIRALGLLGDKYLEVQPGTATARPLPVGSTLVGKAESDFSHLTTEATTTIERVNQALEQVHQTLTAMTAGKGTTGKLVTDPDLYNRSRAVVEKLEQASQTGLSILAKVERGDGTMGKLVVDEELYTKATEAITAFNELAGRLNHDEGTLAKLADPVLYARLDQLTSRAEGLLAKVEHGEGTAGKLITQDALYARTEQLVSDAEELVADMRNNPKKYFKLSVF